MAFCKNCGAEVVGRFCARCGALNPEADAAPASPPPPAGDSPAFHSPAGGAGSAGAMADNVAGALAYVFGFITGIIFLALEPYSRNKAVRFHAWQSIFFSLGWFAIWVAVHIVAAPLPYVLAALFYMVLRILGLGVLVVWIGLIYKAYQGERLVLPIIGPLAEQRA